MTVVATAGHVDHGKSALIEALTGTDPDRWAEEKRRGMTIDLGFAHTTLLSGRTISFVDVPGHSRFLSNMLAGVGAANVCLFVVDVTEGWRAQSEEHLRIVEILGIEAGIVALTKIDLVDAEALELARMDLDDHTAGSLLEVAPVVAVSARTGAGLDALRTEFDRLIDARPAGVAGWPRLWIDRCFTIAGSGTVVTGVSQGRGFAVGDRVVVEPGGRPARIRAIQVHGRPVPCVSESERVALNLSGISRSDVVRGDAVVAHGQWWMTKRFDASLSVLATIDHDVSHRGSYALHVGSGERSIRLQVIGGQPIAPGSSGCVRLCADRPLPLLPGDRYVLREWGRDETLGGGEVLDVAPVLPLSKALPDRRWERVVAERGWVTVDELERLTGEAHAPAIGRWVVRSDAADALAEKLRQRVVGSPTPGLAVGLLDERERALLEQLNDLQISGEWVTARSAADPVLEHAVVDELRHGGLSPPEPNASRDVLRELRTRRVVTERDGVWFHEDAIAKASQLAATLLAQDPSGFTVAQFRDISGTSRKYCLPLLRELDSRGATRLRDPLRIAGPRLPRTTET